MDARSFSALLGLMPATLTGWSVSPGSFRAISVSEGESTHMTSFNVTTGLVASLSAVLAANHVSIFYVSTFETDFVVIKQSQMALAVQVLKETFGEESVEVEEDEEEHNGVEDGEGEPGEGEVEGQPSPSAAAGSTSSAATTPALDPNAAVYLPCPTLSAEAASIAASVTSTNTSLSASSSSTALSGSKSVQVTSPLQLYALPQTFFLAHWREEEVCTHIRSLLQLFFFPLGKSAAAAAASSSSGAASSKSAFASDRFFSYSNIDSAVSMQVDAASLALLQADHHLSMSFEKWRAFQVAGTFGFEECGIVAALSGPLTRASICPYYISSFFTDVCFVQEAKWEHARAILEKEFKFVEREVRPKVQAQAQTAAGPSSLAAAASPHAGLHTSGVLHMPLPHPHHTPHQPMPFHTSTFTGVHPGQAVQSLALMRGISNTSNSSTGGHSIASPAHTRGPSNLHSPAPVDNYAPMGASDVSMPILSAGGVSHTHSHSSNRGSSPSPYDAMGSGDALGGMSRPLSMPTRTTSTGSVTADPSPYDPIGPSGAVSPAGGAPVPLLMTHTSSYSTALAEPSPYDAVHAAPTHVSPAQQAPQPHAVAAAAPSPYAAIGSTDIHSAPMHVVPHSAVAAAPAPTVISSPPVVAAPPAAAAPKPAGAFSLFASAALVMPSSPAPSPAAVAALAPVAAAAASVPSGATPFTVDALSAPVERLSCFRVSVDKAQSIQLLRLGESAAPLPAAAANLYSADSASPAAASSSVAAGDGLFLLRPCSDPSELLANGLPNPNLWTLCYNKRGNMIKTKVYRITTTAAANPQWSLGLTGHRLFPSLHAILTAVVGPHAKPIA